MKKKLPPLMLLDLESMRDAISGDSRTEKRLNEIKDTISHLYTSGWYYNEVLKYFHEQSLFYREAKNLATFVYTRDIKYNPFGFWFYFPYELPLEVLHYTTYELKINSLPTAGYIFALILFDKFKNKVAEELDSAIAVHGENEIKEQLRSLKSKEALFFINNPSDFLDIACISTNTRRNIHDVIDSKLCMQHSFFYEEYKAGSIKMRLWVYDYQQIIDSFNDFRKKNDDVRKMLSTIENPIEGGVDIFNLDKLLLDEKNRLSNRYNSYLSKHSESPDKYRYVNKRIKAKGNKELEKLYNSYESLFIYEKLSYLDQIPIKTNPFLRIYKHKKKIMIACQNDFLDYKLLLSTLYGDKALLTDRCSDKKFISTVNLDIMRKANSPELLDSVARIRINLIINDIGNHQHPISNLNNHIDLSTQSHPIANLRKDKKISKHFEQIRKTIPAIDAISNAGIKIDVEKAKELLKKLKITGPDDESAIDDDEDDDIITANYEQDNHKEYETENEYINDLHQNSLRRKKHIKILKKMLGATAALGNNGDQRIYGQFTPHASSTHRMTCRRLNLQGIPKILKKLLFIAPEGKVLLSADITGQDMAVTANIASKITKDTNIKINNNSIDIEKLSTYIDYTKKCFSKSGTRPIQVITEQTEAILKSTDGYVDFIKDLDLRTLVKTYIYTIFYGGSSNTLLRDLLPNIRNEIIDYILDANSTENEELVALIDEISSCTNITDIIKIRKRIISKYNKDINSKNICGGDLINVFKEISLVIQKKVDLFKMYKLTYENIEKNITTIYPGLIEIFDILKDYTENSANKLTYPTLLGWQTIIDDFKSYNNELISTRSKSYVIQASGAELMREWIFELSRSHYYDIKKFKIIAAIHDQVLIEANAKYEKEVKETIMHCKDMATKNIGLLIRTIIIPNIERVYPKGDSPEFKLRKNITSKNLLYRDPANAKEIHRFKKKQKMAKKNR